MDIKAAKEQIKNAMVAYFTKDEFGDYVIPIESQRPVFLLGPPGIGKTAIMKQVASEMGVGLLSYSMTHHTRQSALGLPFIVEKDYQGEKYSVSEYTMSEIIASVYDYIEQSGLKEGILFLDEINCTSETLAPIMLQFLQYKTFGKHKVPDGWIVVTAGNPPEFNNSVREFDIVTWDRLKKVEIEPNYDVWKEYAYNIGVHPAIMTYLDIKKKDFYKIETTIDGKSFVTARGWVDLSSMIHLYEKHNIKVCEKLVGQYLQNKKIAKDFSLYYDLFNKYKSDYQIEDILEGKASAEIRKRAHDAKFDERLSLIGLMIGNSTDYALHVLETEDILTDLLKTLKEFKKACTNETPLAKELLQSYIDTRVGKFERDKKANYQTSANLKLQKSVINILESYHEKVISCDTNKKAFTLVKKDFDSRVKKMNEDAENLSNRLTNLFVFSNEVFNEGQEMLIIVTELTINNHTAKFISKYGCAEYFKHNKELLFYERQKDLIAKIESLENFESELSLK